MSERREAQSVVRIKVCISTQDGISDEDKRDELKNPKKRTSDPFGSRAAYHSLVSGAKV